MKLKKLAFLSLSIISYIKINASDHVWYPLAFVAGITVVKINTEIAINHLQKEQKNIVKKCIESNAQEPDLEKQRLNLAKAQYKKAINFGSTKQDSYYQTTTDYCLAFVAISNLFCNIIPHIDKTYLALHISTVIQLNISQLISDRFKIRQWNQADSMTSMDVNEFNANKTLTKQAYRCKISGNDGLESLSNRSSLAKNNILLQKEDELIDAMNAIAFEGKGTHTIEYNEAESQLKSWRETGKTEQELNQAQRIKYKITMQQKEVKNLIAKRKSCQEKATDCMNYLLIRNECRRERFAAIMCLNKVVIQNHVNTCLPEHLNQIIISQWLPSTRNETTIAFPKVKNALEDIPNKSVVETFKAMQALGNNQN